MTCCHRFNVDLLMMLPQLLLPHVYVYNRRLKAHNMFRLISRAQAVIELDAKGQGTTDQVPA